MQTNTQQLAAMALLNRGVAFTLPAPRILRMVGKRTISVRVKQMYLGTLLHLSTISGLACEHMQLPVERTEVLAAMQATPVTMPAALITEHSRKVCKAIAACLLNSDFKIKLFQGMLARHLHRHCTVEQLQELLVWIFAYARPESFTNTIKLIDRMTMTKPMNLSHERKGSQGAE